MATKPGVQQVLRAAGEFVQRQQGRWEHGEWEEFLRGVDRFGIADAREELGGLLESTKALYHRLNSAVPNPAGQRLDTPTPAKRPTTRTAKPAVSGKARRRPKTDPDSTA